MESIRIPQSAIRNKTIYPVIMAVPETVKELTPK